jgi:hypothetical protein
MHNSDHVKNGELCTGFAHAHDVPGSYLDLVEEADAGRAGLVGVALHPATVVGLNLLAAWPRSLPRKRAEDGLEPGATGGRAVGAMNSPYTQEELRLQRPSPLLMPVPDTVEAQSVAGEVEAVSKTWLA